MYIFYPQYNTTSIEHARFASHMITYNDAGQGELKQYGFKYILNNCSFEGRNSHYHKSPKHKQQVQDSPRQASLGSIEYIFSCAGIKLIILNSDRHLLAR